SQTDERCSVAGGYVHTTVPPTLSVTNSLSPGRRSFTVLHELGHHLQKNDVVLARAVRSQPAATDAARPPRRWSGCSRRPRRAGPRAALASSTISDPAVSSPYSTTLAASCSPACTATRSRPPGEQTNRILP